MGKALVMDARFYLRLSLLFAEYFSLLLTSVYWAAYSLFRSRGVPIVFSGLALDSSRDALIACLLLTFNAIFFSHLFIELVSGDNTVRVRICKLLRNNKLVVYFSLIFLALVTGGRFDYASYKLQWSLIASGGNPWGIVPGGMVNAYGYVFNSFAAISVHHTILPKLLFVFFLILFTERMLWKAAPHRKDVIFFLCINPFTISTIVVYGFIDGVCSVLLGFALIEFNRRTPLSSSFSGVFLSLSFLTKFYSIVALPLVISELFRSRRLLLRPLLQGFTVTTILVVGVSYLLWGDNIVSPLLFAQSRDPSFLTFWSYVDGRQLRSGVFAVIAFISICCACFRTGLPSSLRTTAVLSIIFGIYYLGHQQFYLAVLVPLSVYINDVYSVPGIQLRKSCLLVFALVIGWLIFIQTGFELFDEFKPSGMQDLIPLFAWANSLLLISSGVYCLFFNHTKALPMRRFLDTNVDG